MKFLKYTFYISLLFSLTYAGNAQEMDVYGGFLDVKGMKTGFFHTEQINNRWWLVTPEGHGFFGIGISHPVTSFQKGAVNFTYNGDQEAWLKDGIKKMRDLGYNCVWSGPYSQERIREGFVDAKLAERVYREADIPHGLHIPLLKHAVELAPGEIRPDVFSPEFEQFVKDKVAEYVPLYKDNPWLIGYYYGFGSFMRGTNWINETLGRKAGSAGREHLISILEERYNGNIKLYNEVYQKDMKSFNDLRKNGSLNYPGWIFGVRFGGADLPDLPHADKIVADADALLSEIVYQLHKMAYEEIRTLDKNHMILGCYVKDVTYSEAIWKRIAPYVDLLAPQDLSKVNPIKSHIEAIGLPAMLSDQEFGNVYPLSLQGTQGAWGAVPDHVDRRILYDLMSKRIAADPGLIGVSFCACLFDNSHWAQAYDRGQPGFFNVDGEPDLELCKTVKIANAQILESVKKPLDDESIEALHHDFHEIHDAYRLIMQKRRDFLPENPPYFRPEFKSPEN
jgi:hypothetical protein